MNRRVRFLNTSRKSAVARKTKLGGIGDPMSELNIQRRLNWWREREREREPAGIIYVSQDMVNKDPALQRALAELDYVQIERHRELR
jgi:hypothetical protein